MSEKRKIQRFNLDEGRIWEAIEGLSPFKTTYTLEEVCEKLNEQQSTIDKLEQRDYYNQSERYKILCRAIELTANYIDNSNEDHYDFCALVTEFEKELLGDE